MKKLLMIVGICTVLAVSSIATFAGSVPKTDNQNYWKNIFNVGNPWNGNPYSTLSITIKQDGSSYKAVSVCSRYDEYNRLIWDNWKYDPSSGTKSVSAGYSKYIQNTSNSYWLANTEFWGNTQMYCPSAGKSVYFGFGWDQRYDPL